MWKSFSYIDFWPHKNLDYVIGGPLVVVMFCLLKLWRIRRLRKRLLLITREKDGLQSWWGVTQRRSQRKILMYEFLSVIICDILFLLRMQFDTSCHQVWLPKMQGHFWRYWVINVNTLSTWFLQHPLEYYPKKNSKQTFVCIFEVVRKIYCWFAVHFFDADGRPLEAGFYTGFPAYHNLVYVRNCLV